MAESSCCFGCCNVRTGAVVVSVVNIIICVIVMMDNISHLSLMSNSNRYSPFSDKTQTMIQTDIVKFTQLSIVFLLFYTNLNLYKSTRIRNTRNVNYWLLTVSIFFIFFGLFICYASIKYGGDMFMPIGIPIIIVVAYQIYLVKSFYDFEVKFLATSERNVLQPTLQGPTYVALPSQTVPNSTFHAQPGPYVIQQIQQPLTQSPYPQQTYQYQPQQPSQSHMVLPMPDQHTPPEYTNPPPYSPSYNIHEGPSAKQ